MRVHFCGVRGSTPAPGPDFVEVGGNTSCIAVSAAGEQRPRLLLDAGTGIRSVRSLLDAAPFVGTILITHLHWDHVQGLPFFSAGDRDDASVRLRAPTDGTPLVDVLRRAMSPPHFPIGPEGLRGHWCFEAIDEGRHEVEGFEVAARQIPHKGGRTFGYRIAEGSASIAYVPDHRPGPVGSPERAAALELAGGVDLLIHDAQFLVAEDAIAEAYGHATVEQAVDLAVEAGARELVLFHHGPARTDAEVRAIESAFAASPVTVTVAREGDERASA